MTIVSFRREAAPFLLKSHNTFPQRRRTVQSILTVIEHRYIQTPYIEGSLKTRARLLTIKFIKSHFFLYRFCAPQVLKVVFKVANAVYLGRTLYPCQNICFLVLSLSPSSAVTIDLTSGGKGWETVFTLSELGKKYFL